MCEAEIQNRERLSVIRVAGKPTLTEATPRLISSRDVALDMEFIRKCEIFSRAKWMRDTYAILAGMKSNTGTTGESSLP